VTGYNIPYSWNQLPKTFKVPCMFCGKEYMTDSCTRYWGETGVTVVYVVVCPTCKTRYTVTVQDDVEARKLEGEK
jgi:transcription elongation factor Elf1